MNLLRETDAEPIAGYRLIEPLGSGGFGEVWKCEAPGGILKAIKFVFGNLNDLDGDSSKAEQEAKAMERVKLIRHPFVISLDMIRVVNGEMLIVMELADKSLHDLFEEYKRAGRPGIPRDVLLGLISDAAEGLDHMIEKHNLQHLDVKPKNLFLIADRVKVADFGLVRGIERNTGSGMMGGITPVYAAPETFANKVSKHSDQYSLAIVYTELLTGQKPFNGRNIRQLAMQHMTEEPTLSMLPECDRAVVAKAMSKTPEERYPTCSAFVKALLGGTPDSSTTIAMPGSRSGQTPTAVKSSTRTPGTGSGTTPPPPGRLPELTNPAQVAKNRSITPPPLTKKSILRFPGGSYDPSITASLRFEPDLGVLRPAILIGIGSFGRRALHQIRCRLLDRVGQLSQVPCLRYLYLDVDADAAEKASASAADVALTGEQLFIAPLQPVNNYRRRQLDHLFEWMPKEKLYAMPRSLRVDGSRALGRLAFCDHYLRFMTRLKHELQVCTSPEAIHQSSSFSGLSVRTKVPAVYLFVSASGGTSGMILDVGHAVKRSLEKMNMADATISTFVLTASPEDPNSPPVELANVFATLTELNHYADTDVPFVSQYGGPEGPQIEGRGLPFTATYLLPMTARTPEAFRDVVSHLSGYVANDLTTPLGSALDAVRHLPTPPGRTPFRGFGTFGVWYPRGLLLRSAARQMCIELLRSWSTPAPGLTQQADEVMRSILADTRLAPEPLKKFIVKESAVGTEPDPLEPLAAWVLRLQKEADSLRQNEVADWAAHAWDAVRDWLGLEPTTETDSSFRRGRMSRALDGGVKRVSEAWDSEVTARVRRLDQLPGPRLGMAEAVLDQLLATAGSAIHNVDEQLAGLATKRERAKSEVQEALAAVQSGGSSFSLFGNRGRSPKNFAEKLRGFIDARVAEDLTAAAGIFYRRLLQRFGDLLREARSARERLAKLSEWLEAPLLLGSHGSSHNVGGDVDEVTQTTLRGSNTMRVVLPHGQDHLNKSASDLLDALPVDSMRSLEAILTTVVLEPRGGLRAICAGSSDLTPHLVNPLVDQSTSYLNNLLPTEDVSAVEVSAARGNAEELTRRVTACVRAAAPLTGGPQNEERTFLLHPDTESGIKYSDVVKKLAPNVYTIPVKSAGTDLMFCREQGGLRMADIFKLIDPCWDAYHQSAANVLSNPHSRFDVVEWLPLVE